MNSHGDVNTNNNNNKNMQGGILPAPPFMLPDVSSSSSHKQQATMQQPRSSLVEATDNDDSWDPTPLSQIIAVRASPTMSKSSSNTRQAVPSQLYLPQQSREVPTSSMSTQMPPQKQTQPPQNQDQLPQNLQQYPFQHQMSHPTQIQTPALQQSFAVAGKVSFPDQKFAFLLPSTLMPPSVLAHIHQESRINDDGSKKTPSSGTTGGRYKKKKARKSTRLESPQQSLVRILALQGYGSVPRITSENAQYETIPSQLQLASFGTELVSAIHSSDTELLGALLESGLSPNPCNKFRDSIVDLICKRANGLVFRCLVEHGCDLRVCDGFGRTPLHHSCWASEFCPEIAETILKIDWQQLFIEDKRGQTPLEYVRPDLVQDWIEFLEDNRERIFPRGASIPPLRAVREVRPDNTLPDPPNALSIRLASALSSGQLSPEELAGLDPDVRAQFS
jgi:hypothetical protein